MNDKAAAGDRTSAPSTSRRFAQEPRPHGRGRRQGARRLSEAARGRRGQDRARRGDRPTWSRPSARSPNTGCPTRSARSSCRRGSARPISTCGRAPPSGWPARTSPPVVAARSEGQALRRSGMASNQFFDFLKQAYLLTARWAERPGRGRRRPRRRTPATRPSSTCKQIANAISPSNFMLTNPELLRETLASNAENLVRGMQMLAEDIEAGEGDLKIRQSDAVELRGRQEPRDHARQGDLPERADAAHPVRRRRPRRC